VFTTLTECDCQKRISPWNHCLHRESRPPYCLNGKGYSFLMEAVPPRGGYIYLPHGGNASTGPMETILCRELGRHTPSHSPPGMYPWSSLKAGGHERLGIRLSRGGRPRVGPSCRSADDGSCNWRLRGGSVTRRGRRLDNLVKNSLTNAPPTHSFKTSIIHSHSR
jgi:hypothetical protein